MDERAHLAAIVESSDDAIIGKTLDGIVVSWNGGAERLYGYSADDMVGSPISRLVPQGQEDEIDQILATIRAGRSVSNRETTRRTRDGRIVDVSVTVSPVRDETGQIVGAATIARDIGERKRLENELEYLVFHDDLTGLANRRRFTEDVRAKISHAARYGWRGAVLLIDLDNFKALNDALGHPAGDQLIRRAGLQIKDTLRESDSVARLGGDEFGVILPEADRGHAEAVAEKLVTLMAKQEVKVGHLRVGTASIGIALLDGPQTVEEPMIRADIAMYEAKNAGGNRHAVFSRRDESAPVVELAPATHPPGTR